MKLKNTLPSVLTLLNLTCGVVGTMTIILLFGVQIRYEVLIFFTFISMAMGGIFDILDGYCARSLGVTSIFGQELDSLADIITFGLLPATLFFLKYINPFYFEIYYGICGTVFYVICAAIRLARYNTDAYKKSKKTILQSKSFSGLPTPGAACIFVTITYVFHVASWNTLLLIVPYFLGACMISTIPYPHIAKKAISHVLYVIAFLGMCGIVFIGFANSIPWRMTLVYILCFCSFLYLISPLCFFFQKKQD